MYFFDNFMFNVFPLIFFIMFFGIFSFIVVKGLSEWSSNNKQPILDVHCQVVSKRFNVSSEASHIDSNGIHHAGHTSTFYYITFQVESGDRIEFRVSSKDYGMIAENDEGNLRFQGTRFLNFNMK